MNKSPLFSGLESLGLGSYMKAYEDSCQVRDNPSVYKWDPFLSAKTLRAEVCGLVTGWLPRIDSPWVQSLEAKPVSLKMDWNVRSACLQPWVQSPVPFLSIHIFKCWLWKIGREGGKDGKEWGEKRMTDCKVLLFFLEGSAENHLH